MAGLQRSAVSFRRQGSSGLVWDDKVLTEELNQVANNKKQDQEHEQETEGQGKLDIKQEKDVKPISSSTRPISTIERSRSNGGQRGYRTGKVSPAIEPPSPRVSACGFCSAFGKGKPTKNNNRKKAGKIRSR